MTIESLRRVMWRLRKLSKGNDKPSIAMLEKAIIIECGTAIMTYRRNKQCLIKLGWLRQYNKSRMRMTNLDLTEG